VVIRVKSKWPRPKDFFIDHVTLEAKAGELEGPPTSPDEWQEMNRWKIPLAEANAGDRIHLNLLTRRGEQWFMQKGIQAMVQGDSRLDVILMRRPGGGLEALEDEEPLATTSISGQRVLGMDVSYAQGYTVDFEKAAEMGVKYCFIRVASGKREKDENFEHQFQEAGRAGMLRGIYYYLYPEGETTVGDDPAPEGQARRFVSLLKPEAELGAVLDVEDKGLTPDDVRRFVNEFQKHDPYDRPIMIYTAAWFWNGGRGFAGSAVDWAAEHPLWVAHYRSMEEPIKPDSSFQIAIPKPWRGYTFHQWTSVGGSLVKHQKNGLDLNYFAGTLTDLLVWAGLKDDSRPEGFTVIGTKYVTSLPGLKLRAAPSSSSLVLRVLSFGQEVNLFAEDAWDLIEVDGMTGYVASQHLSTEKPEVTLPRPAADFKFEVWPTIEKKITQRFGENPDFYREATSGFIPAHEGIDLVAPYGSPYFCVAPGKVVKISDRRNSGEASGYGWHVVVDHGNGFSTLYGHASPHVMAQVGQEVQAGQILAYSGNTGRSSGPHLHLSLLKEGLQLPGWPAGYMDPWPFLEDLYNDVSPPMGDLSEGFLTVGSLEMRGKHLAMTTAILNLLEKADESSRLIARIPSGSTVRILSTKIVNGFLHGEASLDFAERPRSVEPPPKPDKIDLLPYLKGDGRQYEVRNSLGSQERFRTETAGLTFYQVKNAQWEQFFYDNDFIYRDIDTSPGAGRYYRLTDPDRTHGSRWLRRKMAVGETYTQARRVQFYNKADGSPSAANSGQVIDTIKLVAHHAQIKLPTGLTVENVVEIHWVNSAEDHKPKEKYFYAQGYGMVGWHRGHSDPDSPSWSAVSEIHAPGTRELIPRERVMVR